MAGPTDLQYVDITDFSKGIVKDLNGGMTAAPDGAASVDGTYGCIAGPSGGLFPGPKVTSLGGYGPGNRNISLNDAGVSSIVPNGSVPYWFLNDMAALPVQGFATSLGPNSWTYHDLVMSAFSYYLPAITGAGSTPNATVPVVHYQRSRFDTGQIFAETGGFNGANVYPGGNGGRGLIPSSNQVGGHGSVTTFTFVKEGAQYQAKFGTPVFAMSSDMAAPYWTDSGVLTYTGSSVTAKLNDGMSFMLSPDPQATASFVEDNSGAFFGGYITIHSLVSHGGRLVALAAPGLNAAYGGYSFAQGGYNRIGPDSNLHLYNNQQLHFSTVGYGNGLWDTGLDDGKNLLGLSDEGIGPINAMTSVNANQLFLISANRGAITINGDLRNPQVVNLPGVEPSYGATPKPIATNAGVVYGSRSGVFLWNGADSSQELSAQLDGNFWSIPAFDTWAEFKPQGSLGYHHPYLYTPNEYFHDFRTNSWWRLRDNSNRPEPLGHYQASSRGTMIASTVRSTSQTGFQGARIDPNDYSTSWSWMSQPISVSRNRAINVREVDIVVQGAADVQVYVIKDNVQQQAKFTGSSGFSSAYPTHLSFNFDVTGTNIQIRVEATNGVCKLHRMSIGWREDVQVRGS